MRAAKLILINSDSSAEFANALRDILTAPPCPNITLEYEMFVYEGEACGEGFARRTAELSPDLFFVASRTGDSERTCALLESIRTCAPGAQVIVGLEEGEPDQMVGLLKHGAADFITPPLRAIDILPRIWRWTKAEPRTESRPGAKGRRPELKHLIGNSEAFLAEVNKIPAVARCEAAVLITGETGTGKELCARALHQLSRRAHGPFVPVNCGAIPHDLVENELFGHAAGAFTGASTSEAGLIREADGGTLFLDEIDCLPLQSQVKLLRFLQDKVYKPLGTTKVCAANVRVVAAMNTDGQESVGSGRLRRDLYYRLNVIPLRLPPLRERPEDIPLLACHFLAKYNSEFDKQVRDFTVAAVRMLNSYDWPGNVRELEHVVERAVIFSDDLLINEVDIRVAGGEERAGPKSFNEAKARLISQFEKSYLQDLLLAHHGNVSRAARAAHKNRRTLWYLINKHQIDVQRFRTEVA